MNGKKKTHEEFCEEVFLIHKNIKIIGKYNGARNNIKVKCLNCTGEWEPIANSLLSHGCPYCCPTRKKVLIGYNDIWTTNQKLAILLLNPDDGFKYTEHSNKKVDFKCPDCGNVLKNKIINDISRRGISCSKCGDGIPYPEKFIYNLLRQLNITNEHIKTQLSKTTFKWCNDYKYDNYISEINCIIETHGMQHYKESTGNWTFSLKDIQENDKQKEQLAKENGIENYIVLDCRESNLEWIKNSIMNSLLPSLLNFKEEDIDWLKCHEYACNSLVKIACDHWNNGIKNINNITNIINLHRDTIRKYLKQGAELGWCDYDPKKEFKKKLQDNIIRSTKVTSKMVIETGQIFKSISEAAKIVLNGSNHISSCCRGIRNTCGKLEDGTPLHWKYVDNI